MYLVKNVCFLFMELCVHALSIQSIKVHDFGEYIGFINQAQE